jgi:hypothetical protein
MFTYTTAELYKSPDKYLILFYLIIGFKLGKTSPLSFRNNK